jgi:hypothetical protein
LVPQGLLTLSSTEMTNPFLKVVQPDSPRFHKAVFRKLASSLPTREDTEQGQRDKNDLNGKQRISGFLAQRYRSGKDKRPKNREIPMDVLSPEVRDILLTLCNGRKPMIMCLEIQRQVDPSQTSSGPFTQRVEWRGSKDAGGMTCEPRSVRV